jgi:hypothetical protein
MQAARSLPDFHMNPPSTANRRASATQAAVRDRGFSTAGSEDTGFFWFISAALTIAESVGGERWIPLGARRLLDPPEEG